MEQGAWGKEMQEIRHYGRKRRKQCCLTGNSWQYACMTCWVQVCVITNLPEQGEGEGEGLISGYYHHRAHSLPPLVSLIEPDSLVRSLVCSLVRSFCVIQLQGKWSNVHSPFLSMDLDLHLSLSFLSPSLSLSFSPCGTLSTTPFYSVTNQTKLDHIP